MPTFNGDTRTCTLDSGITVYTDAEIYSAWKDWVLAGNTQYFPMFDVEGSEETVILLFIRNDIYWKIKPPEENINVTINGNLLPRLDDGADWKATTFGNYNASIDVNRTLAGNGGGSGSFTDEDRALLTQAANCEGGGSSLPQIVQLYFKQDSSNIRALNTNYSLDQKQKNQLSINNSSFGIKQNKTDYELTLCH